MKKKPPTQPTPEFDTLFEIKTVNVDTSVSIDSIVVADYVEVTPDFVESVRKSGIIHKPVVCLLEKDSDKFAVLSGRRRVLAARQLDWKTIDVVHRKGIVYADALSHIITLEAQNKVSPNPVAEFRAVRGLVELGYTLEQIRVNLGMSPERIKYLLGFGNVPEDVLDGVVAGKVKVSTLESVSRLSKPFLDRAVEKYREQGALTGPDVKAVKDVRRDDELQRVMQGVAGSALSFSAPDKKSASIEITKKALDYMAELTGLDREAAELELQQVISLCRIRSA